MSNSIDSNTITPDVVCVFSTRDTRTAGQALAEAESGLWYHLFQKDYAGPEGPYRLHETSLESWRRCHGPERVVAWHKATKEAPRVAVDAPSKAACDAAADAVTRACTHGPGLFFDARRGPIPQLTEEEKIAADAAFKILLDRNFPREGLLRLGCVAGYAAALTGATRQQAAMAAIHALGFSGWPAWAVAGQTRRTVGRLMPDITGWLVHPVLVGEVAEAGAAGYLLVDAWP